ncbi:MAG: sulfatase-like hydrolase/transferase [Verrucomicrobiales bacterium]
MNALPRPTIVPAFVLALFLASPIALRAADAPREPGDRPNIVLVMADDVGWEAFSCYGAEDYRTPHIDALAERGVRFEHCYSTPICTTTRVKLMTGQYNFRNYTHFGYLGPDERTFGHLLQEAGYATAIAGKWQLNGIYNELPRHKDNSRPREAGFDEYSLWQLTTVKDPKEGGGERFWSPPLETNGRFVTMEENRDRYGPDLLCDFVCDFMERHRERPFFAYYPMVLVHDPFVPTPDTIGDAPRDQSANKQPRGKGAGEAKKANFVAMVEYMDKIVGRLAAKIESLGLSENTIIMFTADNGTHPSIVSRWNGRDIRGGKAGMTDMGTHVPLVVSWKGTAPEGAVLDDLVDFTDFYPTLAEAAGVELTDADPVDGRSFLPRLRGEAGNPRQWVLNHYQPYWNKKGGQFARDAEFKLYRDGRFFHVPGDLEEKHPIDPGAAGDPGEESRRRLESLLAECPPAPSGAADRNATERPVYPDWKNLLDPND